MSTKPRKRGLRASCASVAAAGLMLTGALVAPAAANAADVSAFDSVNPWIGTAKDNAQNKANDAFGNTWPGAALPFGMVQFSPTTTASSNTTWKNEYGVDGAYMTSPTDIYIRGFGMTRLSGTGCNDRFSGFDLPFLPYTGNVSGTGTLDPAKARRGRVTETSAITSRAASSTPMRRASPATTRSSSTPTAAIRPRTTAAPKTRRWR